MLLYKYMPAERIDVLQSLRIRFTQPGDFNDPFEMRPDFQLMSAADFQELPPAPDGNGRLLTPDALQRMCQVAIPAMMGLSARISGSAASLNNNDIPQSFLDQHIGVLSVAGRADNLLMWAHYADHHRGFVLQFDGDHDFFSTVQHPDLKLRVGLRGVEYSEERPMASAMNLDSQVDVLYRKSPDWSYEQEWRLVRPLSTTSLREESSGLPVCLFDVPPEAIRAVILGAAMPDSTQREFINLLTGSSRLTHVKRHNAVLSQRMYAIEFLPSLDGKPTGPGLHGEICEAR